MAHPYEYDPNRPTADQMDDDRHQKVAYEYLCRLDEAKDWMEQCLQTELPPVVEMEESLRNGVLLAKIGNYIAPKVVPLKKIYDIDELRYKNHGLHFRHTDNIVYWFKAMESVGLKKIFYPETTDVYDKKNMPKAVFCLHALSIFLHKKYGTGPEMQSFVGKKDYKEEEISFMAKELAKYGITMPNFVKIGGMLADEVPIDEVALHAAVILINENVENGNSAATLASLKNPSAHLVDVIDDYAENYQRSLSNSKNRKSIRVPPEQFNGHSENEDAYTLLLTREEIQASVDRSNMKEAMVEVNEALVGNDSDKFMRALRNPMLQMPALDRRLADFYHNEFKIIHSAKSGNLEQFDLLGGVKVLNAVIAINDAVDKRNEPVLQQCLSDETSGLDKMVRFENVPTYMKLLHELKERKPENGLVTLDEICACLETANSATKQNEEKVRVVVEINTYLTTYEVTTIEYVIQMLQNPCLELQNVDSLDAEHYFVMLQQASENKKKQYGNDGILEQEEIQDVINKTNDEKLKCIDKCLDAIELNKLLESTASSEDILQSLHAFAQAEQIGVYTQCLPAYRTKLENQLNRRRDDENLHGTWYPAETKSKLKFFINVKNGEICNGLQEGESLSYYLSPCDIRRILLESNGDFEREQGILEEQKRQSSADSYFKEHEKSVIKTQAYIRGWKTRNEYKDRLRYLNAQERSALIIQRYYRKIKARKDRHSLSNPSRARLTSVQTFLPVLTQTDEDYKEELENEHLKGEILENIKKHKENEKDLEEIFVKIGLLVKNKNALEEEMVQKRQSKNPKDGGSQSPDAITSRRFSLFTKSNRDRLLYYQHLIYLLQTKPIYLSRLLNNSVTSNETGNFINNVVLPVYNQVKGQRENYLFLKFLRIALEEEINTKIKSVQDVINGESAVLKFVANWSRTVEGEKMLKDLLQPLVLRLLKDEKVSVNINPVEIYEKWRQNDEVAKTLPEKVSVADALNYPPVRKCLDESIKFLEEWVNPFVDAIVKTWTKIPYPVRYMSKVLKQLLTSKFPDEPERDILKAVGNLVYSQYIAPCVEFPEKFKIIDENVAEKMTEDDKKKLASVEKMLQFASSNMGFGEEHWYLEPMNVFIVRCHTQLKQYFARVCEVADAEAFYGMDEFSDYTLMTKPTVIIAMGDLINLHKRLLQHRASLTLGDQQDELNELLNDFGTNQPSITDFIGDTDEATKQKFESTEILLTLSNKFVSKVKPEEAELRLFFLKTKRYLVDVLMCQNGSSVIKVLNSPTTPEAEDKHKELIKSRDSQAERMTLTAKKALILQNLATLEKFRLVSKSNDYQAIVKSLAEDIRSRRAYREQRRLERARLEESLKKVQAKTKSYEDQLDSYNKYLESCAKSQPAHVTKKKDQVPWSQQHKHKSVVNKVVKASAAKLKDKKIIVSVDNLQSNHLKNVQFTFKCQETVNVFEITKVEKNAQTQIELDFQDLLQKQYENIAEIKLFDQVNFNVNMLISFLNRKFYSVKEK